MDRRSADPRGGGTGGLPTHQPQARSQSMRRRPGVERLEPRCLMAVNIFDFPIPTANTNSTWITTGPNGDLYFTESNINAIGQFNPSTRAFTTFPIPTANSGPTSITAGLDGNLYFTETEANAIGRFNPTSHAFASFPIITANSGSSFITLGSNGDLYFTETSANQIGQFDPSTRIFASYPIPTPNSGAAMITTTPDGTLWFLETGTNKITQFNPTTHVFATYPIVVANSGATFLTPGPDDSLYFAAPNTNQLLQFNTSTHIFGIFPIPTPNSGAGFITEGSDGNFYITETSVNQIGQFNPTTRLFAAFLIPTPSSGTAHIAPGSDGNLYFTETSANKLGEVRIAILKATTTTLSTAPNPSVVGQAVTLTATITTAATGTSAGIVAFSIDGVVVADVPVTVQDGLGQATFSATKLPPGTHVVLASFAGNSALAPSQSQAVTQLVEPAPGDGPVVLSLKRFGIHAQPTSLVLAFDKPLDPTRAQDLANYQIQSPTGQPVPIASVVYNRAAQSVTIHPAKRLNIHFTYTLTVIGTGPSGVADTEGVLLDGAYTGHPGSNYVAAVNSTVLVLRGGAQLRSRARR